MNSASADFVPQSRAKENNRSLRKENHMRISRGLLVISVLVIIVAANPSAGQATGDAKLTRSISVISSAGARALADACTAWAEKNKVIVAMAILDWGGNVIEAQ